MDVYYYALRTPRQRPQIASSRFHLAHFAAAFYSDLYNSDWLCDEKEL